MPTLSAVILVAISLVSSVSSAPADSVPHQLARRGLSWPGRVFGSDRWGVVLGPAPPQIALTPDSGSSTITTADPAVNPAASPASPDIVESESPTILSLPASATLASEASVPVEGLATTRTPSATANTAVVTPQSSHTESTAAAPTTRPSAATRPTSQSQAKPSATHEPEPVHTSISIPSHEEPEPTFTHETSPPVVTSPSKGSGGGTSSSDEAQYLQAHNNERAKHGSRPLTWSDNLAAKAQQWANHCVFQHSGGSLGPFGENLAAGTGSFSIASAIGAWNDESSDYDPSNPKASHFTQVVWKASTQVGCAVATCNGIFPSGPAQFYVCEYSPAGNVIGQITQNVQP